LLFFFFFFFDAIFFFWPPLAKVGITYTVMSMSLVVIVLVFKYQERTWHGFSLDAFREWGEFFKLGAPGALMMCLVKWKKPEDESLFRCLIFLLGRLQEWGSFETAALFIGLLRQSELLAAHTVVASTVISP
jgi:hypothetical protein